MLETGLGNDPLIWAGLQETLAQTTRVYDRAGFRGVTVAPAAGRRSHRAELHDLLVKTGLDGPGVLMGCSIGGLYIRDYASRYPARVKGLTSSTAPVLYRTRTRPSSTVAVEGRQPGCCVPRWWRPASVRDQVW